MSLVLCHTIVPGALFLVACIVIQRHLGTDRSIASHLEAVRNNAGLLRRVLEDGTEKIEPDFPSMASIDTTDQHTGRTI